MKRLKKNSSSFVKHKVKIEAAEMYKNKMERKLNEKATKSRSYLDNRIASFGGMRKECRTTDSGAVETGK